MELPVSPLPFTTGCQSQSCYYNLITSLHCEQESHGDESFFLLSGNGKIRTLEEGIKVLIMEIAKATQEDNMHCKTTSYTGTEPQPCLQSVLILIS